MIYVPVNVRSPIATKPVITIQKDLTNNYPDIIFELHDKCTYFDLGDDVQLAAAITNPDMKSVVFTGTLQVFNPHRGQILCSLNYSDFTMTGINTLTILCTCKDFDVSFQKTIFVDSIHESIQEILRKE